MPARLVAAVAMLMLFVACGKDSETPSPIPTPPPPPPPSGPTMSRLEVDGPSQMAPGQSAQFTVIAYMSDSTTVVPTGVRWIASPGHVVQVDQSGLATAASNGGAAVTAELKVAGAPGGELRASKGVIVLPDGTFLMTGFVFDAEFFPAPLDGALVEVTPGSLSAKTNSDGFYRIHGVPPGAEARVTKTGYQQLVQPIGLASHGRQDFALTISGQRLILSGLYTLAIDADDGCSAWPADLRIRRYDALLTQNGLTVHTALTEPRFQVTAGRGNQFSGRVDGPVVMFQLGSFDPGWDYYGIGPTYPDVAERLPNGTFLIVYGTAAGTGSADSIVGTLSGGLVNYGAGYPTTASEIGSCWGKHRFTLTRR